VGVILRGQVHFRLPDGTEFEAGPMSLVDIPSGHDAWVEGDEPLEMITWTGARGFLAPLESFHERILATLVFTDIVDSTGTALRLGDRVWGDLVASHEARTREILARFRGALVKLTGDGVLATFDGAARALRCAAALREAAADLDITLRLAVHTGEVEVAGDDIRGVAVHEASRILALAGADEILVSAATASLAEGSGVRLEDRGEFDLRGIPGTRRLYAVT
jgi:class 3 adenylate cyclase